MYLYVYVESININLWIPNPKQPTQPIPLHGKHKKNKKALIYGSIYCRDALTIDIIRRAKSDSSSQKQISAYWWWILLFYGCYLASSSFIIDHTKKKPIVLHIKLDTNYIQYSFQHMNMIG